MAPAWFDEASGLTVPVDVEVAVTVLEVGVVEVVDVVEVLAFNDIF